MFELEYPQHDGYQVICDDLLCSELLFVRKSVPIYEVHATQDAKKKTV